MPLSAPARLGGGVGGRVRARPRALLPGAAPATGRVSLAGRCRPGRVPPAKPGSRRGVRPESLQPGRVAPAARPWKGRRAAPAPLTGGRVARESGETRPPRPSSVAAARRALPVYPGADLVTVPRVRGRLSRDLPTRLETRTKESIGPASRRALKPRPRGATRVKTGSGPVEAGSGRQRPAHRRPATSPLAAVAEEERAR